MRTILMSLNRFVPYLQTLLRGLVQQASTDSLLHRPFIFSGVAYETWQHLFKGIFIT
jgi:hypothetical protein